MFLSSDPVVLQVRDEEAFREQEERRNRNALTETDTRMRTTTVRLCLLCVSCIYPLSH